MIAAAAPEVTVGNLFNVACRYVFPHVSVRLQPMPNLKNTNVYQLHTRTREITQYKDFAWRLQFEGTLEDMARWLGKMSRENNGVKA